jgi:hypothetical protein
LCEAIIFDENFGQGLGGNSREKDANNDGAMQLVGYGSVTALFLLGHGQWLFNQFLILFYAKKNTYCRG